MEFKFAIGDYVTLKAHVDLYDLAEVGPLVVSERLAQQCEGGEQRHYECRPIIAPGYRGTATCADGFMSFKEYELVALDIEAYKAARREASTGGSWSSIVREAKSLAEAAKSVKT